MAVTNKRKAFYVFIALAVLIAIAVIWYFFLRGTSCDPNNNGYDKKGNVKSVCKVADPNITHTAGPPSGTSWIPDTSFPLKRWSWGPKVKALQEKIGVTADGRFGPKTEAAVYKKLNKYEVSETDYNSIVNPSIIPPSNKKNIDDYIGSYIKTGSHSGITVRYIKDDTTFKTYGSNENIGTLGNNVGNGYHRIFDVVGDDSSYGLKISDQFLKAILNIK